MSIDRFIKDARSPLDRLLGDEEREWKAIPWPTRPEATVALWCLTQAECEQARKRAYAYVRDALGFSELDLAYDDQRALNEAVMIEVLAVALRDPTDRERPFAQNADALRKLRPEVLGALFQEYLAWQRECSPFETAEDLDGELERLVDAWGKGSTVERRLTYFDTPSLRGLLHTAVGRLASAPSDNSSRTSPPNASAPPSTVS